MRKEALYQKYRSQSFDEVIGQKYVVTSIRNAIKEGQVGHAYLFCGPRGTGKTTMARLLARSVNCENPEEAPCGKCANCLASLEGNHPDIVEINAANETHVEDVRDLIERARLAPMMGHHKIYIIDEVHQLSSSAASALLKTLEEPPEHVIFVLATTDPQKLLPTIISRCQRFDFSKVKTQDIADHLLDIAKKENVILEKEAANKIAILADGGMRDSLSMLEQAIAYTSGNITDEAIDEIYGLTSVDEKINFLIKLKENDLTFILERIEHYEEKGIDFKRLTTELIDILKDIVIYNKTNNETILRLIDGSQAKNLSYLSNDALAYIELLMKAMDEYRSAQSITSVFEIACLKITCMHGEKKIEQVIEIPKQTQKEVKEEHFVSKEVDNIDTDKVLQLLVQCDKENKNIDNEKLEKLNTIIAMDRYIAALKQVTLVASGKDCLLFKTNSQAICNTMNEEDMNKELYKYLKEKFAIDKMIYVIKDDIYQKAVNEFVERRKTNSLPEALKIVRYSEEIKTEEKGEELDTETKLKNLFGDDLQVYD